MLRAALLMIALLATTGCECVLSTKDVSNDRSDRCFPCIGHRYMVKNALKLERYAYSNYASAWPWHPQLEPASKEGVLAERTVLFVQALITEDRLEGILEERDARVLVARVETGPFRGRLVDVYDELYPAWDPKPLPGRMRDRGDLDRIP